MLDSTKQFLQEKLQVSYPGFSIQKVQPVSGGSINQAYCLVGNNNSFFVKINSATRYPNMFELERKGVELLHHSNTIRVPGVIDVGTISDDSFILMEWVEKGVPNEDFWENFGQQLAAMHKSSASQFGLDHDNYIGSLEQSNAFHANWVDFFVEERLTPQLKLANFNSQLNQQFQSLFQQLDSIFPKESPALLHGDLWSGNFMADQRGEPAIFDPAVYYGHREMDISMTQLFGGFSNRFYSSYHNAYPLETGWQSRVDVCNLYPLLVHVNLFGGGYVQQVKNIVNKFA